eukprot:jgi/Mesvir1/20843/Mv07936-RA.1
MTALRSLSPLATTASTRILFVSASAVAIRVFLLSVVHCDTDYNLTGVETFTEELLLRPLPDGHISAYFHFGHRASQNPGGHTWNFPKAVDQLVREFSLSELHLHFTQGRWDHDRWGVTPMNVPAKPTGVELWATFDDALPLDKVASTWHHLTHVLAGLFCASLGQLGDPPNVVAPSLLGELAMLQQRHKGAGSGRTRYGVLPQEAVCTENLTPWLKLLPCRDRAGLAALLAGPNLYGARFLSQGLEVRVTTPPRDQHEAAPAAEIVSSFPDPLAPGTAAPGSKGDGATQGDALSWAAVRSSFLDYDLRRHAAQGRPLDVQLRWLQPATWQPTLRYPLEVHMAITGNGGGEHASILLTLQQVGGHSHSVAHGDQSGTMTATDAQPSSRDVHLLLVIPWYLRVYLHTLECSVDGGQPAPLLSSDTLLWHRLHPARDREAALLLELRLRLLASAGLVAITIDAEKAFLQYSEHPPDAHHGFPIPSAMATYSLYGGCLPGGPGLVHGSGVRVRDLSGRRAAQDQISNETRMASWTAGGAVSSRPLFAWNQRGGLTQLYSEGTLVHLATPDFSMPYNVITLTSTVLALLLGSLLNILLRRRNKETA